MSYSLLITNVKNKRILYTKIYILTVTNNTFL